MTDGSSDGQGAPGPRSLSADDLLEAGPAAPSTRPSSPDPSGPPRPRPEVRPAVRPEDAARVTVATVASAGWRVLTDVVVPGRAQPVDLVLVGPGGVVVVDVHAWNGDVRVRDGVLRHNGYRRDRHTGATATAAAAVAAVLPPRLRTRTRPVLVVADRAQSPAPVLDGTLVVGAEALVELVRSTTEVLDVRTVEEVADSLVGLLAARAEARADSSFPAVDPLRLPDPVLVHAGPRRRADDLPVGQVLVPKVPRRQGPGPIVAVMLVRLTLLLLVVYVGVVLGPSAVRDTFDAADGTSSTSVPATSSPTSQR